MLTWLRDLVRRPSSQRRRPAPVQRRPGTATPAPATAGRARGYDGPVRVLYAPDRDGDPDPGEVVWTWVPYEEDPAQGKDRPVVVVGQATAEAPGTLAVVPLSSQDHDGDPGWMELGSGPWDREGRVSSVRLDRVLAVAPQAVRREGSALDRARFEQVAGELRRLHGWG
jgi:mRNA-degrading endonuclease toxin of MazEF toxin-antitoxin module